MKKLVAVICSISIIIAISLTLGCGGGGGGGSSNNGNDLFKVINTFNKNISADSATQIGVLSSDGIQLSLAKGALNDNSNIAVRQYSNDAAMARFTENFSSLASFTVVSSLYELTAKDNKSKTLTVLEIPSEVEVALTEDLNTNKLYYAVVKQNGEWTLLPLQNNSSSNSSRLASNASRSIKMIFNTIYEFLFIVTVTKKNATNSKLTYAEDFIISLNGSETSPQTITASYTQKFDNDIEASLRLTLKGDVSPDKAEISITALQNENKKISIKKSDKTYKDFDFTTAEQRGKYQTTFKLTSDLATSKLSGNTATYNFIIKAKDIKVSDMPTKLILKASVKGSSIFYSNDIQINFVEGQHFYIKYYGNGNTSGNIPFDAKAYNFGDEITVASAENLEKKNHYFISWNTKPDGTGISYNFGEKIIFSSSDIALYAIWKEPTEIKNLIISEDTLWSKKNSPYKISGKVQVAYGATLTIEPGVVLLREGTPSSTLVSIFGNLRMVGTSDEPITANRIYFITGKNTESNKYPSIDIENSKLYRCALHFDDYAKNVIVKNNDILHPKDDDYDEYGRSAMLIFNGMNETIIENNIFDTETSEIYVKILCGGRASKNIFKKYTNIDNIDLVNNLFCQGIRLVQVNSAPFIRYNSFLGTSIFYTSERSDFEHDISNNYWGNADEKTIKAMLHDKNSDLGLCGEFIYKPMLKTPHKDTPKL
jgi:hypothetical protein